MLERALTGRSRRARLVPMVRTRRMEAGRVVKSGHQRLVQQLQSGARACPTEAGQVARSGHQRRFHSTNPACCHTILQMR